MGMLATLIAGLASGETAAALRRAKLAAMVYAIAGVLTAIGVIFLVVACYIWTAMRYGPIEAAAGFGVAFLVLAGLIVLIFRLSARSRTQHRRRRRKADLTALGVTTALALLPTMARGKGGLGLILGPAAALFAYEIYRENRRKHRRDPDPGLDR
jgi:hypothetical protein